MQHAEDLVLRNTKESGENMCSISALKNAVTIGCIITFFALVLMVPVSDLENAVSFWFWIEYEMRVIKL